ncbi:DUF1642 domain-containing protein [Listeria innocua]|nr:DUF1642 domain-containing protein [Listeria monocytogenes]EKY4039674.1 DUF1642 domain-containing protein [Listeria innocua]EIQ9418605.1 DUF1642 domain-containing protein [Listeria monocytogenes]EIQ9421448.1 DUF1642 domain-containing protein [Listeria monocytogenes]EIQ9517407.1 DUF1642 domain-containing protein [Listeria monocytogenes]
MRFKTGDKVEFIYRNKRSEGEINGVYPGTQEVSIKQSGSPVDLLFSDKAVAKVEEQERIVVPQFVADAIDTFKDEGDSLAVAIDYEVYTDELVKELSLDRKMRGWLWETSNQELFARAWMGEYEVEQEPLYYVRLPIVRLNTLGTAVEGDYKYLWADQATGENNIFQSLEYPSTLIQSGWKTKFTESEIKNMDTRYWAFAVPVEDLEETS